MSENNNTQYRENYLPPDYLIPHYDISFSIEAEKTWVWTAFTIHPAKPGNESKPIILDGEQIELHEIRVNGQTLSPEQYQKTEHNLILAPTTEPVKIDILQSVQPDKNTDLSGLYSSDGLYCTQCEPESFRRISYGIDRPDNMATFTVRIEADKETNPVLLSNGDKIDSGDLGDCGRHYAVWHDWRAKPTYLFALVSGDLAEVRDTFTTKSGHDVDLAIYVEHGKENQTSHAMTSLKNAMEWDEEKFGREYPYQAFKIVAVSNFNFGAMENNTLNIFNDKYVLASPETSQDTDYRATEQTVVHEFFHDATGNTITCRDWFALTLKEGLTRLRDQLFTEDAHDANTRRISEAKYLRLFQFPEDRGPFAHPIQPDSYVTVENFYTPTVYEKGAEVIRMMRTTVGEEAFRKGFDLYFERHSCQAVDCEDFIQALEDGSGKDLTLFRRWYHQAGTPELHVNAEYDQTHHRLVLDFSQHIPTSPGQATKLPVPIPVRIGLPYMDLEDDLNTKSWRFDDPNKPGEQTDEAVFLITEAQQKITFENIPPNVGLTVAPSLLRGFSAPVTMTTNLSEEQEAFLARHDTDGFNRWEFTQKKIQRHIIKDVEAIQNGQTRPSADGLVTDMGMLIQDGRITAEFKSMMLTLPDETSIGQWFSPTNPIAIHQSRRDLNQKIGTAYAPEWQKLYESLSSDTPYTPSDSEMGRRGLRNNALRYWAVSGDEKALDAALHQALTSDNLTDRYAATSVLVNHDPGPRMERALEHFYQKADGNNLVIDQWFTVQATSSRHDTLDRVEGLLSHPDFNSKNPNRAKSLIAQFANLNQRYFHDPSGRGYEILGKTLSDIDKQNPQLASVLSRPLRGWAGYTSAHRDGMKAVLEKLGAEKGLSKNMREVVEKSLGTEPQSTPAVVKNANDNHIGHVLCKSIRDWVQGRNRKNQPGLKR